MPNISNPISKSISASLNQTIAGFSSGGDAPSGVPIDLGAILWLDASDATTITAPVGGKVTVWADKSGYGNNATQSVTDASRPITGTRTMNSLNALDFDGIDDFLDLPSVATGTSGFTIGFSFVKDDGAVTDYPMSGSTNGDYTRLTNAEKGFLRSGLKSFTGSETYSIGAEGYLVLERIGLEVFVTLNGGTRDSAVCFAENAALWRYIASASFGGTFNGLMGEMILIDGELTSGQKATLETYLSRWIP